MKILSLNFDKESVGELTGEDAGKSSQELCYLVCKNIIITWGMSKQGLSEEERRKFYKICDAFESLLNSAKQGTGLPEEIKLDDSYMEFISQCKKESKLFPNKLLQKVEELIDGAKDAQE